MTSLDSSYDVIVVGAGLVGSAFALSLSRRFSQHSEFKIAVVERAKRVAPQEEQNQRVVALGEAAIDVLKQVDVYDSLGEKACYPYGKMFVWDQNTDGELAFNASDYDRSALGYLVDSVECVRSLQSELENADNITSYYGFEATSVAFPENLQTPQPARQTENGPVVELHAGDNILKTQLIVAADGNRSWVRQQAKIMSSVNDYDQAGIVAKIKTERSHDDCAWQRFLETGPIAVLPIADNESSIVWSASLPFADELMAMSDSDFEEALSSALEGKLGKVEILSKRLSFPLQSLRSESYFKRGVALIGDAAHAIHPLAGQGANLGFKDAACLVDVLASTLSNDQVSTKSLNKRSTLGLGDLALLEQYERARKMDNQQTDMLMNALHLAYKSNAPWWLGARSIGMNWINSTRVLKRLLAMQAMGI